MPVIALIFVMLPSMARCGEPTICHLEPLDSSWHYRTSIAPLRAAKCWYLGPAMKPRRELYWPEAPTVPPISIMEEENEQPPFELRWKGE